MDQEKDQIPTQKHKEVAMEELVESFKANERGERR